jgi:hypothetical protein
MTKSKLEVEGLVPLVRAALAYPVHVSYSATLKWAKNGILESQIVGKRYYTSLPAVRRSIDRSNQPAGAR